MPLLGENVPSFGFVRALEPLLELEELLPLLLLAAELPELLLLPLPPQAARIAALDRPAPAKAIAFRRFKTRVATALVQ